MAQRRNVQQQTEEAKASIRRSAERFRSRPQELAWLEALLISRGMETHCGILAKLTEVPEQEGNQFNGVWLSQEQEFWEFEVVVSRESGEIVSVDQFENTTAIVRTDLAIKGKGKPFGRMAIEVLLNASA